MRVAIVESPDYQRTLLNFYVRTSHTNPATPSGRRKVNLFLCKSFLNTLNTIIVRTYTYKIPLDEATFASRSDSQLLPYREFLDDFGFNSTINCESFTYTFPDDFLIPG